MAISKYHILLWLALLLSLAPACTGPQQTIKQEASRAEAPAWVEQTPASDEYHYLVGVASRAASLEDGQKQAFTHASAQAASLIGVLIQSELQVTTSTERLSPRAEETTAASASGFIAGLEVLDEYYTRTRRQAGGLYEESYDVYLLCRYSRENERRERDRQRQVARENAALALEHYRQARADIRGSRPGGSLYQLRIADRLLQPIQEVIPLEGGRIRNSHELKTEVELAMRRLNDRSRSLFLQVKIQSPDRAAAFRGAFHQSIARQGLDLAGRKTDARFFVPVGVRLRRGGRVMGQQAVFALYHFEVQDLWLKRILTGNSREVSGFGRDFSAGADQAVIEAGTAIAREVGPMVNQNIQNSTE